jgi:hypothetical protein
MTMESTAPTPPGMSRPPTAVPYISAMQAAALLRSGNAIASELISNAFGPLSKAVFDEITTKWEFEASPLMVRRLINDKMIELKSRFLEHLKHRQDEVLASALQQPSFAGASVNEEHMTLVDAATVSVRTVAQRAGSRIQGRVEEQLRSLHVVVRFLVGKQTLSLSTNPYTPDVFVHALLAAAEDEGLNPEAWDYFLKAYEEPMAEEIGRIHATLLDHFGRHGLDPRVIRREFAAKQAAERSSQKTMPGSAGTGEVDTTHMPPGTLGGHPVPSAFGGHGSAAAAPSSAAMASAAGVRFDAPRADPTLVLNSLLARLQANAHDGPIPALPRNMPPEPALLDAVGELQSLGLQGLAGATLSSEQAGQVSAWRGHLIEKSTRTVDKLTIELVGMLFDHVMQDQQVPAEIKALLSRLQFPVLKAALLDADFFAASTHPARRLIDRIASTSVGWEPYGDENDRYRQEVERVVKTVLGKFEKDIGIFDKLLTEFENFVGEITPRDSDPVARAKRALEEAEKREVLVINTTIQVRRAFEKVELEPYLRDFLVGPWVQVLVTATLRDEQTPGFSKRFREAIHDVVWSVLPKANADDRRRLTSLIPELIRVLRDGAGLIRMPEHEAQQFFRQLMESHAVAVKPVDQATYIKSALVTSEVKSRVEGLQITGTHPITTVAGGIRVSTGAVMRAAAEHDAEFNMPEPVTDIGNLDRVEEAHMDEQIASWQRGTWFEVWDGAKMIKARLRWISPLRTLFLFSSNHEKDALVLPPNVIKSYLKREYIKPMEAMPLTRRAVDGLVGNFERMPKFAQDLAARFQPT